MNHESDFSSDDAVYGYLPLMHELVIRLGLVAHACEGHLNLMPPYAREYAYLQFRYICELIALGCLQLHGDLPKTRTKSARKEWNAEKIMSLLYGEYKGSFPQSATMQNGPNFTEVKCNSKPNALTLQEFKQLYSECGEVLHRGTIRTIKATFLDEHHDYNRIINWQSKIVDLMNEHFIGRANKAGFYVISLKASSGFPECSIFKPNEAGTLDVAIKRMKFELAG